MAFTIVKYIHWVFVFVFVSIQTSTIAQTTTITELEGLVVDADSKQPIPFVNILILPDSTGVFTDFDGRFSHPSIEEESILIISCLAYKADTIFINDRDISSLIEIELIASPILSEEVIISSSKKPQSIALSPASIEVITKEQLLSKSINTFDQILDYASGLHVTRSSGSNIQAVSIRGASEVAGGGIGNRVLLLIDGRPALSPESGGALWNLIPIHSIEKIEILKGAYSSLYGSSAVGGVINVITKKPGSGPKFSARAKAGLHDFAPSSAEYETRGYFTEIGAGYSNRFKNIGILFDTHFQTTDGHREKSSFDLFNIYGKLDWTIATGRKFVFSGGYNSVFNDTPASWLSRRLAYSVADYKKDDFQDREELSFDLQYQSIANSKTKYSSKFYYYRNFSLFDFNSDPQNDSTNVNIGKQTVDIETVSSYRFGSNNQIDLFFNNHYFIGGVDLHYDDIEGIPDTVLYGKHQSVSVGVYVQDEIKFTSDITFTAGLRYDYYNIIDEFAEANLSPKLAFVYNPKKQISFRALYARAFRNPSMAERYIKFEQGGGLRFMPNPDLRSEKLSHSFEIGSLWRPTSKIKIDFSVYYNLYKDLISFKQIPTPDQSFLFQVVNLKKALMKGFEISSNYRFSDFTRVKIGYNFLDAQDTSEGRFNDNLAYKIKHSFNYSFTIGSKSISVNFYGRFKSAVKEVFIYPGSEPGAYWIHNLKFDYRVSQNLWVGVAFDNFTNTLYEELERYRMPGRSANLQLQFSL